MRNINSDGIRLIQTFEGCKLKAYRDIKGILTIGYGHTGDDIKEGLTITQDEATELLKKDLATAEQAVYDSVKYYICDHQFSACVCLCYNIGQGNFKNSTVLKQINAGHLETAADHFLDWCKSNGKTVPGLLRRRQAERKLFLECSNG